MEGNAVESKNEEEVPKAFADERKKRQRSSRAGHLSKKPRVISRKKKPGFDSEVLSETSYYFKNGLRCVKPYYFTFTTHAKGRWVGATVYDVFSTEFQAERPEYYEAAIKSGKVHVNGKQASMTTVIGNNDLVCHRVHRHEPPVNAEALEILHTDEELVVINKPASIPIHPCGRYRHNSVLFILAKEHDLKNLHTVHRLDRLTSGLLILAKSLRRAQQLEEEIRERKVTKEYVCRVKGEFPSNPVECDQPILVFSHKLGLSRVDPEGKPCSTHFTRLSHDGNSSIVLCWPKTGRMHQIRVHLQWLGHPIVNDPLYNHPAWQLQEKATLPEGRPDGGSPAVREVGRSEGAGGCEDEKDLLEDVVSEIIRSKFSFPNVLQVARMSEGASSGCTLDDPDKSEGKEMFTNESEERVGLSIQDSSGGREERESASASHHEGVEVDPDCTECKVHRKDPLPSDLVMYLHALSYKGEGWSFSTPMPSWAVPDSHPKL